MEIKGNITLYTLKELASKSGFHYNIWNNIVTIQKGHTINWYREIEDNRWENYNCTSEGY